MVLWSFDERLADQRECPGGTCRPMRGRAARWPMPRRVFLAVPVEPTCVPSMRERETARKAERRRTLSMMSLEQRKQCRQPSATGQMAWYKGKLWLHAGDSGVFIVDPKAGTAMKAIDFEKLDDLKSTMGKDHIPTGHIRVKPRTGYRDSARRLGGLWRQAILSISNCRVNRETRERVSPRRTGPGTPGCTRGYPDLIVLSKANGERSGMPVWDAGETLLLGTKALRVGPTLCSHLGDILAAEVAAHPFNAAAAAKGYWNDGLRNSIKSELPPGEQRPVLPEALKRSNFLTPLLAGNAVVFLSGDDGNWHVVAVSRTDAALLWDIRIPAQPAIGGLSMTCAGDVLAPLVDGRVVCIGSTMRTQIRESPPLGQAQRGREIVYSLR